MYFDPRAIKRPIKDRLGPNPSFPGSLTPSTLDHQSLLERNMSLNKSARGGWSSDEGSWSSDEGSSSSDEAKFVELLLDEWMFEEMCRPVTTWMRRQNNVKWSDSVRGEKNHVSCDGPKHLAASAVQKDAHTDAKNITSHATEIQKKTLGDTQTPRNVHPSESKRRSAIEANSTKARAIGSASAPSSGEKKFVANASSMAAFLQRLGLTKYLATFQAEEIDMFALKHMNEHDLKSMGLPMGPRKKILHALAPAKTRK